MPDITSHDGPRGAPPKKDLPPAFLEFLEGLFCANQVFEEKADAGREGIVLACHAVARFIAVTHQNPLLVAPLLALRGAILDLEKGIANPILTPGLADCRRSRSSLKKHAIAVAAVCLETLVELGDPVDEAALRVARYAGEWRVMGDQLVTATTVKNWRNHQRALPAEERKAFELMRNDLLTCGHTRGEIEALLHDGPLGIPKT